MEVTEPVNEPAKRPNALIRSLDAIVVSVIQFLVAMAHLRSRDPREHASNIFRPDPYEKTRIRNWQGVLQWSPEKRVGCFVGVAIGVLLGGAFLWYNLN